MIVKWDLIQGTEEWHLERYRKIGGTTSKGLFIDSDTLLTDLVSEHLEPFEMEDDGYISNEMLRGSELEPLARRELSVYIGMELLQAGWLQSEECDLIGVSPDGITECCTVSAEIKCPGKKKHTKTIMGGVIPADNIHQCLHYFTVNTKLERHYFMSFRPESRYPMFIKMLTPDSLIDLGTKAKPNIKPISEWAKMARGRAMELEANIPIELKKLEQI